MGPRCEAAWLAKADQPSSTAGEVFYIKNDQDEVCSDAGQPGSRGGGDFQRFESDGKAEWRTRRKRRHDG